MNTTSRAIVTAAALLSVGTGCSKKDAVGTATNSAASPESIADRLKAHGLKATTPLDVNEVLAAWWSAEGGYDITKSLATSPDKKVVKAAVQGQEDHRDEGRQQSLVRAAQARRREARREGLRGEVPRGRRPQVDDGRSPEAEGEIATSSSAPSSA